ncbi:MAG: subfamily polymerase sigma-24 subunit [Bacteroidetes bacterium]|nr:subfamily polymerase sigma-24 subunit [Bacteroidota bacterium]
MTKKIKYSEEELVALLQQKDKKAFEYLYDNYSDALYGITLKIVRGDTDLAHDILQEAFVKIWKNFEKYDRQKSSLFTWILNITRNHAIDTLRSKRYKYEIQNLEDNVRIIETTHTSQTNTDTLGVKQAVETLLDPEQQLVIDAIYFNGLTQEEASKELNIPLGTVKTRVRIALRELRKIFK